MPSLQDYGGRLPKDFRLAFTQKRNEVSRETAAMTREMMRALADAGLITVAEYLAWVQAND